MQIKNIQKAADRITAAVKNKERIILYGDSDLDGVTSVIILKETIATLGGEAATCYFPDRHKDGYGLNLKAVEDLKPLAPALIVMVDLGISNIEEIPIAQSYGLEVVIIDHHKPHDELPAASIIVDPKQPGDDSLFT